jgi:hypothetical protein
MVMDFDPVMSSTTRIEHWSLLGEGVICRAVYLQGYESAVGDGLLLASKELYDLDGLADQHYITILNQCHMSARALEGQHLDLALLNRAGYAVLVGPDYAICSIEHGGRAYEELANWAFSARFRDDDELLGPSDEVTAVEGAKSMRDAVRGYYERHIGLADRVRGTPVIHDLIILHAYLRLISQDG